MAAVFQEQASWVCRCEDRVVQRLEQDFKVTLQQQNSLEQWAGWLDGVVSQVLKPYQGSAGFPKAAKLFLLKWSFYRCAQALRDPGGKGRGGRTRLRGRGLEVAPPIWGGSNGIVGSPASSKNLGPRRARFPGLRCPFAKAAALLAVGWVMALCSR